jgi:hypothetical protein
MLENPSIPVNAAFDGMNFVEKVEAGEFHDQGDAKWIVIRRSL